MNLVDVIKDQLSSGLTNKLGSLIGGTEAEAKTGLAAAVPALLSAFSGVASAGGDGASRLASAVSSFDTDTLGRLPEMLAQAPDQALEKGNNLLSMLLGGSGLSGLTSTLAKFVGFDFGSIKKLLSFAAPMVMGAIAKQFQGKQVTPQGLRNLFADQKANIANALPSGLSLAGIPGLSEAGAAVSQVAGAAKRSAETVQAAGSSLLKSLLPVAALALLLALAWQFFRNRENNAAAPAVAGTPTQRTVQRPVSEPAASVSDTAQFTEKLNSFYAAATTTLSGITDAASAEAALPKLDQLSTQIDGLKGLFGKLPAAARSTIANAVADNTGKLTELIAKVSAIPGVGEKLQPVLDGIVKKLRDFSSDA